MPAEVLWFVAGVLMMSEHRGMPMGCVAVVHAWHRAACVLVAHAGVCFSALAVDMSTTSFRRTGLGAIGAEEELVWTCLFYWSGFLLTIASQGRRLTRWSLGARMRCVSGS